MIPLTRPDGTAVLINPDRIELVEETPDTVITLADGKKMLVRETAAEVATRLFTTETPCDSPVIPYRAAASAACSSCSLANCTRP